MNDGRRKGLACFREAKAALKELMFEQRSWDAELPRWGGEKDCARLMEEFTHKQVECSQDLQNQVVKSKMEVHSHVTGSCDNFREGGRNGGGKLFCCLRNISGFSHNMVMGRHRWI